MGDGTEVLSYGDAGPCNTSHGWAHAGRPRSLGLTPRHVDRQPVTSDAGDRPTHNDAYRRNDWGFVGGEIDQGFFWCALKLAMTMSICATRPLAHPCRGIDPAITDRRETCKPCDVDAEGMPCDQGLGT